MRGTDCSLWLTKNWDWLLKGLGLLHVLLVVQVTALFSDFCILISVISYCVFVSAQCKTLGSPLNSAFHSFPPKKTNRQRGRQAEKRERAAEKTKESERSSQTDSMRGKRDKKQRLIPRCICTSFLLNHELALLMCAPALTRRWLQEDLTLPHLAYWGYRFLPTPLRTMKSPHPRVFTQKTAYKGRSIGVNYHRASVPAPQPHILDGTVNPGTHSICVFVCMCD